VGNAGQAEGNSIPRGAWTGPPSRAREDVVEKYPGVKKGR